MYNRLHLSAIATLLFGLVVCHPCSAKSATDQDSRITALIAHGEFAEAEKLLQAHIPDPAQPVTTAPAIQLEILRRTRYDFALTDEDVLAEIRQSIPDATQADVDRWRDAGDLRYRVIDGQRRYFRRAVSNLYRFNAEARSRQQKAGAKKAFDIPGLVAKVVRAADSSSSPEVYPVKHHVHFELAVRANNPRVKPGAVVRAWLPFPQEYRQQKDVKLISSDPAQARIASIRAPQRTVYFEEVVADPAKPPRFQADFEFVTSAYCPKLDPAKVRPYDVNSAVYREYTAERPPHIVFTPQVKSLAPEIVGDETNPLKKALLVFRWVSKNIRWCAEQEYSIIPSLSVKGLTARRGDCGVQGTSFITLCRAAGIPARWQSGWQTKPGDWNMHDWSEIYIEPWGWLPADASYGVQKSSDPRVRDFFCGHIDPYRMIVNLDYGRQLEPPKISFRSEPTDFQRGEIEIDGHNLYFDEWDYKFEVKTTPLADK
jgi:transglutaminase-like putative cysteine protease